MEEAIQEVIRPKPELIAPYNKHDSRASLVVTKGQGLVPKSSSRSLLTRSKSNRALDVSNRLYALGKLYEAKKEILRERQSMVKKEEEDKIMKMG